MGAEWLGIALASSGRVASFTRLDLVDTAALSVFNGFDIVAITTLYL
jgi:hypothetical protein